jgi:hypothetical protein
VGPRGHYDGVMPDDELEAPGGGAAEGHGGGAAEGHGGVGLRFGVLGAAGSEAEGQGGGAEGVQERPPFPPLPSFAGERRLRSPEARTRS